MLICAELELELYNHIIMISERYQFPDKNRAIALYIIYILRLFHPKCATKDDLEILTNCFVMINNLIFHSKIVGYEENLYSVKEEDKGIINSMLLPIVN